jgi:hypothetical protein
VTVSVSAAAPTALLSGLMAEIAGLGSELSPVPDRETLFGLPGVSLTIARKPSRKPAAVGENFTLMEQLLPLDSVGPHVFVCTN